MLFWAYTVLFLIVTNPLSIATGFWQPSLSRRWWSCFLLRIVFFFFLFFFLFFFSAFLNQFNWCTFSDVCFSTPLFISIRLETEPSSTGFHRHQVPLQSCSLDCTYYFPTNIKKRIQPLLNITQFVGVTQFAYKLSFHSDLQYVCSTKYHTAHGFTGSSFDNLVWDVQKAA